jgi:TolB-like protein/Flp pilus assembly protein TadD
LSTPDIFLSYNREDAAIARAYAEAFVREGLDVWWDATLRSGEAYDKVTEAALRGAKAVVVLWSPRSVESRWVRAEATIADRNGTLMPVTIERCNRPVMFELTQTAELSHWRGAADDKAWRAFLDDVRRIVARSSSTPVELTQAPVPATAKADSGVPSVAMLPISYRGGGEQIEFLAEDLTEDITRELGKNRFFKVIAVSTMAALHGKVIDSRAAGREVEARYLVESKLQQSAETIRLTVQLIDTATGGMLWSERIARKLADFQLSPEELPAAVATELGKQILEVQIREAMAHQGPFSAWQHLMRCMAYHARVGSDSLRRHIEEAREATSAAPDLGIAHAVLASALAGKVSGSGQALDDALRREIQAHVTRAVQLDGDNPMVIARLVTAYTALEDGETCLRLARRAVELNPYWVDAHHMLGAACLSLGRTADAIPAFTEELNRFKGNESSRNVALTYLGMSLLLEGQPIEAEAAIDRALALRPDAHLALKWKAIVAAQRGKEEDALAAIRRLRDIEPSMSIDQHVWQINRNKNLAKRSTEAVTTLRRLWNETGGDA